MSRADDIQQSQSRLQRELDKIQKQCSHKDHTIKWCAYDKNYMWQCDDCNARVAYPSIIEMEEHLK